MPLRSDPSLPWNLPGVVAYYQPVRAPDSLLARYNMAHGGDNRYRAEPGTLPAWSGAAGWSLNGTTQYLRTGFIPPNGSSLFVRFADTTGGVAAGVFSVTGGYLYFLPAGTTGIRYRYGYSAPTVPPTLATGVVGISAGQGYRNGVSDGSLMPAAGSAVSDIFIGALNESPAISSYFAGTIQAVVIVMRGLSPAEVWTASRQMAYCDVNPDWSVWSPRRKWFPYVLQAPAGRAGIYGARPTVALPGGVRIVPQDEGGVNG